MQTNISKAFEFLQNTDEQKLETLKKFQSETVRVFIGDSDKIIQLLSSIHSVFQMQQTLNQGENHALPIDRENEVCLRKQLLSITQIVQNLLKMNNFNKFVDRKEQVLEEQVQSTQINTKEKSQESQFSTEADQNNFVQFTQQSDKLDDSSQQISVQIVARPSFANELIRMEDGSIGLNKVKQINIQKEDIPNPVINQVNENERNINKGSWSTKEHKQFIAARNKYGINCSHKQTLEFVKTRTIKQIDCHNRSYKSQISKNDSKIKQKISKRDQRDETQTEFEFQEFRTTTQKQTIWEPEEEIRFFEGFRKYGKNLDKVTEYIMTRSKSQVEAQIALWKVRFRNNLALKGSDILPILEGQFRSENPASRTNSPISYQ